MLRPKALDHVGLKVTDMDIQVGSQELNVFPIPSSSRPARRIPSASTISASSWMPRRSTTSSRTCDRPGSISSGGPVERRDGTALFVQDPDGVRVELELKVADLDNQTRLRD
jgi:hypothetical protein